MRIVDAVRRAIEEDAQECWSTYTRFERPHDMHLTRCSPDGFDAEINNRYEEIKRGSTHISELQQMTMPQLIKIARDERPAASIWVVAALGMLVVVRAVVGYQVARRRLGAMVIVLE